MDFHFFGEVMIYDVKILCIIYIYILISNVYIKKKKKTPVPLIAQLKPKNIPPNPPPNSNPHHQTAIQNTT
jgi:hypothetical protein